MADSRSRVRARAKRKLQPPSQLRIKEALKTLLKEKVFGAITWAEIAVTAGSIRVRSIGIAGTAARTLLRQGGLNDRLHRGF